MKGISLKNKLLRNAISHGLIWYESEQIYWVDNIESSNTNQIAFLDFIKTIRKQSLTLQCLLWVTGHLIRTKFFSP